VFTKQALGIESCDLILLFEIKRRLVCQFCNNTFQGNDLLKTNDNVLAPVGHISVSE
jgi:hypothetical protein